MFYFWLKVVLLFVVGPAIVGIFVAYKHSQISSNRLVWPLYLPCFLLAAGLVSFNAGGRGARLLSINVGPGDDLQAAINQAASADGDVVIMLAPGATFTTPPSPNQFYGFPFLLPRKRDSSKITITTSTALPASLRDLSPQQILDLRLPRIITRFSTPAIEFAPMAGNYDLHGIEITNDSQDGKQLNNGIVFAGEQSGQFAGIIDGPATVPHDIVFDRCYVHPEISDGTTSEYSTSVRGFVASAKNLTVENSRVAGFRTFWKPGETNPLSSNALLISKGPGPYTFVGNYAEAWFGTVFTGGGPQWVTNSADVAPGATLAQATLVNIAGQFPHVGAYIALEAPGMTYTVGVYHGQSYQWGAAKITSVATLTPTSCFVTYTPMRSGNLQSVWGEGYGGTPLTSNPNGRAVWEGDRPTDILIQNNRFVKEPVSLAAVYAQYGYAPKGHLEFKVGNHVSVDANVFEDYHLAFVLTPRNQGSVAEGAGKEVWSALDDVRFTNNWVRAAPGIGQVFGIQLEDETNTVQPGSGILSQNNLYESGTKMMNVGPAEDVRFIHDTFLSNNGPADETSQAVFIVGGPVGLTIRDSIFFNNAYGFNCQVQPACFPTPRIQDHNVIVDNRALVLKQMDGSLALQYPFDLIADSQAALGLDATNRLLPTSPFVGRASDGTDPGCDVDELRAALGNLVPKPAPTPVPKPVPKPIRRPRILVTLRRTPEHIHQQK